MKKFFAALFACALGVTASAQIGTIAGSTSTEISTTKPVVKQPSTKRHYFRAGYNANTVVGADIRTTGGKAGYNFVLGSQRPMGTSGLYWGMEWGFTSRGCTFVSNYLDYGYGYGYGYSSSYYDYDDSNFKLAQHGLTWTPFQIGFKAKLGNVVALDPHMGLGLTFWYMGFNDGELQYEDDLEWCTLLSAQYSIGAGVWFKNKFNIDYTCEIGLTPFWTADGGGHHINHMLRLGIAW